MQKSACVVLPVLEIDRVGGKVLAGIKSFYEQRYVRVTGTVSSYFSMNNSLRQGSRMSPRLSISTGTEW